MVDRLAILKRVPLQDDNEDLRRVKEWLADDSTRPVADRPAHATVKHAAGTWGVRLKISLDQGNSLYGAKALLDKFETMAPQKKLEQYGFHGTKYGGNVFFEQASGAFVGVVMVDAKLASSAAA